jgi:hypothetical protein
VCNVPQRRTVVLQVASLLFNCCQSKLGALSVLAAFSLGLPAGHGRVVTVRSGNQASHSMVVFPLVVLPLVLNVNAQHAMGC